MITKSLSLLLLLLFLNTFTFANESNKIIWLQHNRPPWLISQGPFKDQGYGDKVRAIIKKKYLLDYEHISLPVNPSRENKIITKTNQNICFGPNLKHKQYLSHFYWSKAVYTMPKARIILTKEKLKELNNIDEISMEELIKNESFRFGYIKSAKYYPFDITKYIAKQNVITISSSAPLTSLLKMMRRDRVDWIFDHPVFITWEAILNKRKEDRFRTIKIKEFNKTANPVAYMACRKNAFGKKVIDRINQKLTQNDILEIRKELRNWQLDDKTKQSFDKLNLTYFGF